MIFLVLSWFLLAAVDSFWLLLDIMALFGLFVYLFLAGVDMLTVGYVDQRVSCDGELLSMVELTH